MLPSAAAAAPSKRDYKGPANPPEAPVPPDGDVTVNPPAETPKPTQPPPPRQTAPVHPPEPGPPVVAPGPTPAPTQPGPGPTPPTEEPPVSAKPAPAEPRPTETPVTPAEPPAEAPVEDFGGEEGGDGFEVVDLTEDPEALKKELQVDSKKVKGAAGVVAGQVKDSVTGEPVIGAYVEAIGTGYRTKTDFDGNYSLELPPGQYEIRIRYDTSEPRRISGVTIAANETQTINSELRPLAGAGQVVKVEAEMNRESAGARMLQRKKATETRDLMSREEIAKSGGGSTSTVARQIVGVSLVGGRYIFVRGLGHRYGNTLFDGARVPSPEPELRTVPLDIFPSSALSAINVQKTFSPDTPGDFAGGSVQLESREVPDEFVAELGAELGVNTATTFRSFVTHEGFPSHDAFGFGNLPRGLPDIIPDKQKVSRTALDENFQPIFTDEELEAFGESLVTRTAAANGKLAPTDWALKGTLGYGFSPYNGGKLGFLAAAAYKNQHRTERRLIRRYGLADGELDTGSPAVDFQSKQTTYTVSWSTIGLLKYDITKNHRLSTIGFYSREADDESRRLSGLARNVSGDAPIINSRLRYVMRSILLTRLGGEHRIPQANDFTIDWFGSYAQARRDDPAIRGMVFTDADMDGTYRLDIGNDAGTQLYLDLVDHTESGALNFTAPFEQWGQLESKIKFGAWAEGKQRTFETRRFVYSVQQSLVDRVPDGTGNIINDRSIGGGTAASLGGTQPFFLTEGTRPVDNYNAHQEVFAGYAMIELPFVRWFKIAGGMRFEQSTINVESYDIFADPDAEPDPNAENDDARLVDRDYLPAAALIFSPNDKHNIRLGGSRTLARPEFRELAPFTFTDFVGGTDVQGNPDLVSTKIWNADLRWEWFVSAREVIAASVFYKFFDEPIERVQLPRIPFLASFRNADGAQNVGFELEAKKNLEFIWKRLANFSLGGSFAYIYSRVKLRPPCDPMVSMDCFDDELADVSTSRERPLQDQSPWDISAYFDYDNTKAGTNVRLIYDAEGPKIAEVGGLGLPDVYQRVQHRLHLVYSQRVYKGLKLTFQGENLLNWPVRWTQGGEIYERYYEGVTFSLGLDYEF